MGKFEESTSAESALIIYGETVYETFTRDDGTGVDTVGFYTFKLCIGEDGPSILDRRYISTEDYQTAHENTKWRLLFDDYVDDYNVGRMKFQSLIKSRIAKLFLET